MSGFPLLLALDTGSPVVSVAAGRGGPNGGQLLAERSVEIERSSGQLLELIQEVLAEVGAKLADLGGIAALRGPGSFTGLRIGLATVLGFHQALGARATALPTLQVLAAWAAQEGETIVAAVDALRGDWSAQAFLSGPEPESLREMQLVPGSRLPVLGSTIVGFGVTRLAELPDWPAEVRLIEPGPLAGTALRLAGTAGTVWDPDLLVRPLYSRPPAITQPRPR
jgi:tRNA threonylcarbamoyl adenosine modification protein YeaZ